MVGRRGGGGGGGRGRRGGGERGEVRFKNMLNNLTPSPYPLPIPLPIPSSQLHLKTDLVGKVHDLPTLSRVTAGHRHTKKDLEVL